MFGIINRGVSYKSTEVISKLYISYVRPHLKYCIQFWSPLNEKDADMLVHLKQKFKFIVVLSMHDSFPLLVLFLCNHLDRINQK